MWEFTFFYFSAAGCWRLALANLETLRLQMLQHREATDNFSRRWVSLLIALVLMILGLGVAAVSIFSPGVGEAIVHALGFLG